MEGITTLLTLIALFITLGAQIYVSSTYNKYSKIQSKNTLRGSEVARKILDENGLTEIGVEEVSGHLTDHYDPKHKVVRLSSANFQTNNIAAISVAAHECGHAIQDKEGYSFMRLRASLVPIVNFSSYGGYIAIVLGCFTGLLGLVLLGIICEIVILLFQLVTLPVEFDASKRALKQIETLNILETDEHKKGKKVLRSAALTYVASVAAAILEILRLLLIFSRRND